MYGSDVVKKKILSCLFGIESSYSDTNLLTNN